MVAINSALAWKLVVPGECIKRAAEALERIAEAERELEEAEDVYASALRLFHIAADEESSAGADDGAVPLHHEGAVLLSLVCHKEALAASRKYGFDVQRAMEYGFRAWAQTDEGRRFIRHTNRKLRDYRR